MPVVFGWYAIGTQSHRNDIRKALVRAGKNILVPSQVLDKPETSSPLESPVLGLSSPAACDYMGDLHGDLSLSNISSTPFCSSAPFKTLDEINHPTLSQSSKSIRKISGSKVNENDDLYVSASPVITDMVLRQRGITPPESTAHILMRRIAGDEEMPGPLFNYARVFTWAFVARKVISAHEDRGAGQPSVNNLGPVLRNCDHCPYMIESYGNNLNNRVSEQRSLTHGWKNWSELRGAYERMFRAIIAAIAFHAIPTMMAFLVVYFTPTVGLGCRSLAYAIYLSASILSAVMLIIASILSDWWMWVESSMVGCVGHPLGRENRKMSYLGRFVPNSQHVVALTAVLTRVVGKLVAYLNGLGLILHCLFQFTNFYRQCFCMSSYFGLRERAFVSFLTADEVRESAERTWAACLAVSLISMLFFMGYIKIAGRKLNAGRR